jgi:hypothetical protein
MDGPYLQLGCCRNSVPVQYCTQAPSHGQRGDTNQEDFGFQTDVHQNLNMSLFKIPSLFHAIKGISKLNNWGKPSPAEKIKSLNLACCKHQTVDNRRDKKKLCDSLLR